MAIQHPDIQPAVNHSVQVAIAGAGPVGLMMANYLGQMGIDVLVVEKLDKLIDYPRAIGIDDEALRTMQSVGLVDNVLPHTTPWHAMRFLTPKGRCFADIQPMTDEFGWPRRNAFIQPQVDAVMLTSMAAEKYLEPKNPCVLTGLPVRAEFFTADKEKSRLELGVDSRPLILSSGGSLGAEPINKAMVELIAERAPKGDCCFIHATGHNGTWVADELKKRGVDPDKFENVTIREYIDDMSRCMAACDLFINRAGASTLSEIEALGKPSILIPSPYVAENHQYHNAMTLVEKNAAVVIEEKNLTGEKLVGEVEKLLSDRAALDKMGENAREMCVRDAAKRIYDCLCKVVG